MKKSSYSKDIFYTEVFLEEVKRVFNAIAALQKGGFLKISHLYRGNKVDIF
jgi:hypothetical protein